jgi:GST-like protein
LSAWKGLAVLTLYGSQGSGSASIECALQHCKQPYRVVRASTWEPKSAQAELARINPLKQIPTLVLQDGTVISECAAILIHLALAHPKAGLLPQDANARASALRGLVFIAANCYAAISVSDYPQRWTTSTAKSTQEKVREAARANLHRYWDMFADMFEGAPYLNGKSPGALDYFAVVVSKWSGTRQHLKRARPGFAKTLKLIEADPLVAEVFARHWP